MGSLTAFAQITVDDFKDEEIQLKHSVHYTNADPSSDTFWNEETIVDTGWLGGFTTDYIKYNKYNYSTSDPDRNTTNFIDRFSIKNEVEPIVDMGDKLTLTVTGLAGHTLWGYDSSCNDGELLPYQYYEPIDYFVYAIDLNGNWKICEDASVQFMPSGSRSYDLIIDTGVAPFNAHTYEIDVVWHFEEFYNDYDSDYKSGNFYYNRGAGFIDCGMYWSYMFSDKVAVHEQLEVQKSILETLKELPSQIVLNIEESLINLFVPDNQAIIDMQEDWNNLLADRFGALYQVGDLVSDFADAFNESEQKTVTLPSVTVPVGADGWTFGGWEIQVVPDGMEVLFTTLKTLVSIVATFLFVNGLKRRFDSLIGGAPTA